MKHIGQNTSRLNSKLLSESGRIGYVVLWLMGFPAGILFLVWLFLGNNILGRG